MDLKSPNPKWFVFISIFFLVNIILSSYFIDTWPTPNSLSRVLPVLTFFEERTIQIDKYADLTLDKSKVGDHFYSDKAPLPTFCMIPIYALMQRCGLDKLSNGYSNQYPIYFSVPIGIIYSGGYGYPQFMPVFIMGSFIFGTLPFVLMVMMSFKALHKMRPSISPVLLAMMAWYGSFIFVYSGTFFNHIFAGFMLLLSFVLIKRNNYFLSGVILGLGFLSEYTLMLAAPFWLICIWIKERKINQTLTFTAGVIPSVFFIAIYNWLITGSPWTMLNAYHACADFQALQHHYGFSFPSVKALWGLSFSIWKGLFNYVPVLYCIAIYIILAMIKKSRLNLTLETRCLACFGIAFFLTISSFFTWWGGWSYGPRYLIILAVLLLYEGMLVIAGEKISRFLFFATALLGLAGSWIAKATVVYMVPFPDPRYEHLLNPFFNVLLPAIFGRMFNANNALTAFFNISPQAGVLSWLFVYFVSLIGLNVLYRKWFSKQTREP